MNRAKKLKTNRPFGGQTVDFGKPSQVTSGTYAIEAVVEGRKPTDIVKSIEESVFNREELEETGEYHGIVEEAFKNLVVVGGGNENYRFFKYNRDTQGGMSATAKYKGEKAHRLLVLKISRRFDLKSGGQAYPAIPDGGGNSCPIIRTTLNPFGQVDPGLKDVQIMDGGLYDFYDAVLENKFGQNPEWMEAATKWIYGAAACLLDHGLVATDWKLENIVVMTEEPFVARLIDSDSIYAVETPSPGQYTVTQKYSPVLPLEFDITKSTQRVRAQMVFTMLWAVMCSVYILRNQAGCFDLTAFTLDGERIFQWDEFFFMNYFFNKRYNPDRDALKFMNDARVLYLSEEQAESRDLKRETVDQFIARVKDYLIARGPGKDAHKDIAAAFADLCSTTKQ